MHLILPIILALGLSLPALAQEKAAPPSAKTDVPKVETQTEKSPATEAPKAEVAKPVVTKNDDWFVGCQDILVEGQSLKACEMQQVLEETTSGQAFIRISMVYPRGTKKPLLRIMTPLGVLLQKGLAMKIDDGQEIVLPFAICINKPPACIVEGVMEDSIVNAMKRGNGGTLTISFGNNNVVKAPFSLTGFTKSITSIAPK